MGKILGPQGNTIKRLQEETGAKISVLGKGSMRDKAKVSSLSEARRHPHASMSNSKAAMGQINTVLQKKHRSFDFHRNVSLF